MYANCKHAVKISNHILIVRSPIEVNVCLSVITESRSQESHSYYNIADEKNERFSNIFYNYIGVLPK